MGEELCISYVDSMDTTEGRQDKLQKQYYFTCKCDRCTNGKYLTTLLIPRLQVDNIRNACLFVSGGEIENLKHALLNEEVTKEQEEYIIRFSKDMIKRMEIAKKVGMINIVLKLTIYTLPSHDINKLINFCLVT